MDRLRMTVFDGDMARKGYGLNRFAKSLTTPAGRDAFAADPHGTMRLYGLTEAQIALVDDGDWQALLEQGAAIYLLAKIAIAKGGTLLDIGAQMRGQTAAEFAASLPMRRG